MVPASDAFFIAAYKLAFLSGAPPDKHAREPLFLHSLMLQYNHSNLNRIKLLSVYSHCSQYNHSVLNILTLLSI